MNNKTRVSQELAAKRAEVYAIAWEREGGRFISCGRAATDMHEIKQRSHYRRSKQLENNILSVENCVAVCRVCHGLLVQTQFGELCLRVRLHVKDGYKWPDLTWWN